jgi:hypothetical protein
MGPYDVLRFFIQEEVEAIASKSQTQGFEGDNFIGGDIS